MDSTRDNRQKIAAAVTVDQLFESYEIEVTSEEALSFIATAPADPAHAEAIYRLIAEINVIVPPIDFGPNHPRTGTTHHMFRIGRRHGERVLALEIYRGYFPPQQPIDALIEAIESDAKNAGCSMDYESDENSHRFRFTWPALRDR